MVKLIKFLKEHRVDIALIIGLIIFFVYGISSAFVLRDAYRQYEEDSIKQEEAYRVQLEEQINEFKQELEELKQLHNDQQEETNSRLEELDTKITTRKAEERKVASATNTTTQPKSELQEYAHNLVINEYGWTEEDFTCLVNLWNRESGWNPNAHNSSSGAHGIPQALPASKMASEGDDYYTNGETQIRWRT